MDPGVCNPSTAEERRAARTHFDRGNARLSVFTPFEAEELPTAPTAWMPTELSAADEANLALDHAAAAVAKLSGSESNRFTACVRLARSNLVAALDAGTC